VPPKNQKEKVMIIEENTTTKKCTNCDCPQHCNYPNPDPKLFDCKDCKCEDCTKK